MKYKEGVCQEKTTICQDTQEDKEIEIKIPSPFEALKKLSEINPKVILGNFLRILFSYPQKVGLTLAGKIKLLADSSKIKNLIRLALSFIFFFIFI